MTISTQQSQNVFLGNGVTTVFAFNFVADSASDLIITYIDANGNYNVLESSQYTLAINSPATGALWGVGGTVTYPITGSPIASGTSLLVQRSIPYQQNVTISNQGAYAPTVTEEALDVLEMQIQQLLSRSGQFRGIWATGVLYNYGDIVIDGVNGANTGNWYMCIITNTSGVWSADLSENGYWQLAPLPTGYSTVAVGGDLTGNLPNPTIAKIQGNSVSGTTGTGNVVFSANSVLTGTTTAANGSFSGQISATTGLFTVLSGGAFSGFVNKFRNGDMLIAKRGTSGSVATGTSSYTLDGWILSSTGATTSWSQGGPLGSTNNSGTYPEALALVGNSSMTQTSLLQRIESSMAAPLAGQTVTLQFTIENNTGATLTPTFNTYYPTAVDNWGGQTADASGTFPSIASGATTTVAYTFNVSTNAYYGYAVYLYFGSALNANTKNVYVTGADLRATPGIATGANSNPPVVERRPIALEDALNTRYLFSTYNNGVGPGTSSLASPVITIAQSTITTLPIAYVGFPVKMRATPTVTIYSPSSGTSGKIYNASASADVAGTLTNTSGTGIFVSINGVAAVSGNLYEVHVFATAEL